MSRTVGVIAFAALLVYFLLRALVLGLIRLFRRWRRVPAALIGPSSAVAALAQPLGIHAGGSKATSPSAAVAALAQPSSMQVTSA